MNYLNATREVPCKGSSRDCPLPFDLFIEILRGMLDMTGHGLKNGSSLRDILFVGTYS
jgi:hypothetical protein